MQRIRQKKVFDRLRLSSKKIYGSSLLLVFLKDVDNAELSVGLTVSKKVGNAVVRNKVKRRLRAILSQLPDQPSLSRFLVNLIAKPDSALTPFAELKQDVIRLFDKLNRYAMDE